MLKRTAPPHPRRRAILTDWSSTVAAVTEAPPTIDASSTRPPKQEQLPATTEVVEVAPTSVEPADGDRRGEAVQLPFPIPQQ